MRLWARNSAAACFIVVMARPPRRRSAFHAAPAHRRWPRVQSHWRVAKGRWNVAPARRPVHTQRMPGHDGSYRGVVLDVADPTSEHRIQVQVPDVSGEAAQWAGAEDQAAALPTVGDEVTIHF